MWFNYTESQLFVYKFLCWACDAPKFIASSGNTDDDATPDKLNKPKLKIMVSNTKTVASKSATSVGSDLRGKTAILSISEVTPIQSTLNPSVLFEHSSTANNSTPNISTTQTPDSR